MARAELMGLMEALEKVRAGDRPRGAGIELNTKTKMFSAAANPANTENHDAEPNTLVAPVDMGLPGSMPRRSTLRPSGSRSRSAWRWAARSPRRAASRGRTTSTRISARTTRSASTTSRSRSRARSRSTWATARRSWCRSSARTWRRTRASSLTWAVGRSHPGRVELAGRLQPRLGRAARRDRDAPDLRGRAPRTGARQGVPGDHPRYRDRDGHLGGPDGAGQCALRRERVAASARSREARHPHRDEERQLDALGRARRALRDPAPGGASSPQVARSRRRPGTGTRTRGRPRRVARSRTPTITATSPSQTCCLSHPARS